MQNRNLLAAPCLHSIESPFLPQVEIDRGFIYVMFFAAN